MGTYQKIGLAGALSLLMLGLAGCGETMSGTTSMQAPAPSVRVAAAVEQRLVEWGAFTGRLEAPDRVEVKPRVSGYIDQVSFEEGTLVKQGQLLFQIDPRPFQAEVAQQEAALAGASAALQLAEREYARGRKLREGQAISLEQLEARQARKQDAEAQVAAARAALESARLNLEFTQVRAAIDGRVSRAMVTAGNYVNAGQTSLTSLVSTDKVYAYFDADEQTYLKFRAQAQSMPAIALLGLVNEDGHPHQGTIDFIDNQIDSRTGTMRARAVFSNEEGFFTPGLFARIKVVVGAEYPAVLIQDAAVGTDLSNKYVLVLNSATQAVDYRPVSLGEKVRGLRVVKTGLKANEVIVVSGLQRVRPGAKVQPEQTDMADAATLRAIQQEVAQALASGRALAASEPAPVPARQANTLAQANAVRQGDGL